MNSLSHRMSTKSSPETEGRTGLATQPTSDTADSRLAGRSWGESRACGFIPHLHSLTSLNDLPSSVALCEERVRGSRESRDAANHESSRTYFVKNFSFP